MTNHSIKVNWAFTVLCFVNGVILYASTLMGKAIALSVSEFFGFPAQAHLMRNSGVLLVLLAVVNAFSLLQRNHVVDQLTYALNSIMFMHYIFESFVFRSLRLLTAITTMIIISYPIFNRWIPSERPKNYT
jgi:hypothetical protein